MLEAEGPNAQQIEYWNEISGPKWVLLDEAINRLIAPLGDRSLEVARVRPGERVLDVGCGCGLTTIALAKRVGTEGSVIGIDISAPMLESARQRRLSARVENATFLNADAQTRDLSSLEVDLVFSRFGVMFFAEPVVAFRNLRTALRSGGRLTFACWREMKRNPWMVEPMRAVAEIVESPPRDPGAPGPFSLADSRTVQEILEAAGFAEIRCDSFDRAIDVMDGRTLDETVAFLGQMGPTGALLRDASEATRRAATQAMRVGLETLMVDGRIELGASVWLVTAILC